MARSNGQKFVLNQRYASKFGYILTTCLILTLNIVYFTNLAVKAKIHINASQAKDIDRQLFLDYYDLFPKLPKYKQIKPCDFKKKPLRLRVKRKQKGNKPTIKAFEDPSEIDNSEGEAILSENADCNANDKNAVE